MREKAGYVRCGLCGKVIAGYQTRLSPTVDPPDTLRAYEHGQYRPPNAPSMLHCAGSCKPYPTVTPEGDPA